MSLLQKIGLTLACLFILASIEAIALKVIFTEVDTGEITATTTPQTATSPDDDTKVIITRLGTSSIKKLELTEGFIYFADGWAVFVPNKQAPQGLP